MRRGEGLLVRGVVRQGRTSLALCPMADHRWCSVSRSTEGQACSRQRVPDVRMPPVFIHNIRLHVEEEAYSATQHSARMLRALSGGSAADRDRLRQHCMAGQWSSRVCITGGKGAMDDEGEGDAYGRRTYDPREVHSFISFIRSAPPQRGENAHRDARPTTV